MTCPSVGRDTVMDLSTGKQHPRNARMDHPQFARSHRHRTNLPSARKGRRQGETYLGHLPRHPDRTADRAWTISPSTPGLLLRYVPLTAKRMTGIVSRGGSIMAKWCLAPQGKFPLHPFRRHLRHHENLRCRFFAGRRFASRSIFDANDEAQLGELKTLGELDDVAWKHDGAGDDRGPGPRADAHDQGEHGFAVARLQGGAVLYLGALTTTSHQATTTSLRHRRGDDRLVRHRDALLCHAQGAPGPAEQGDVKDGIIHLQNRGARGRFGEGHPGAQIRDNALSKARFEFRWEDQFNLGLTRTRRASSMTRLCRGTAPRSRTSVPCAARTSAP